MRTGWRAIKDFIREWWWDILVVGFIWGMAWALYQLLMAALDTL
jgi:hypothetical protein